MSGHNPADDVIDPPGFDSLEVRESGSNAPTISASDQAIRMAREYPRSIKRFTESAIGMVSLSQETAIACMYALPKGKDTITGPSVRLAEIIAHSWGNIATESFVKDVDSRFLTARANVWDLESNLMIGFDVKRKITDRHGRTFKEDVIVSHANAAASIAFRNSVLKCVPFAYWKPVYDASRKIAVGTEATLAKRRADMLEYAMKSGITNDRVFAALGVRGVEDIDLEKLLVARAAFEAVKNNEIRLDTAFPPMHRYEDESAPKSRVDALADRLKKERTPPPSGEDAVPKPPASGEGAEETEHETDSVPSEDAEDFVNSIKDDLPDDT